MAARLAERMPSVQASRAVAARLGHEVHDGVHALKGHQRPRVTRMPRLSTGFAAALPAAAAHPGLPRETIRGRRLRRQGGVLLLERELALQIRDACGVLLKQLPQPRILLAQSLDLRDRPIAWVACGLLASRRLLALSTHRRERTKSLQKVQVQNLCHVPGA
jgi:hypothetical protein